MKNVKKEFRKCTGTNTEAMLFLIHYSIDSLSPDSGRRIGFI